MYTSIHPSHKTFDITLTTAAHVMWSVILELSEGCNVILSLSLFQAAILQQTAEYIFSLEQEKTRLLQQNTQLKRYIQVNTFDPRNQTHTWRVLERDSYICQMINRPILGHLDITGRHLYPAGRESLC